MGHITSSTIKRAIAPIRCWKAIRPDGEAHANRGCFYSPGQTMPEVKFTFSHDPYRVFQGGRRCTVYYNTVNAGYHSYTKPEYAEQYAKSAANNGDNLIVREFEVPAGAWYFRNNLGDIVSNIIHCAW